MSKYNGGPAFPVERRTLQLSTDLDGMTLRDYFAGQCDVTQYTPLENLRSELGRHPTVGELAEYVANVRLIEADAMLAERTK